ncbi:trehalose-phosphatase [Halotalea alkalilenta]|uniref:trehalose-phosphatase n=1 Tax=Halotalea alkalilenta TaxID=376489 RepID=UPI0005BC440E|nr:trehalose-phosphatase [Halotalea alkalilenta]
MPHLTSGGPPPVPAACSDWALLLDFDGTLTPLVDRPEAVELAAPVKELLIELQRLLEGAIAVVSGRPLEQLGRFLHPFAPVMLGQHGAQWQGQDGRHHTLPFDAEALNGARVRLAALSARHPGLQLEDKGASLALHYRNVAAERLDSALIDAHAAIETEARRLGSHVVHHGKCVFDLRLAGSDKGQAVDRVMGEAPFRGRKPVFVGDDLTDEDGFRAAEERSGITIKVGEGESRARYRLQDPAAVHAWLAACLHAWRETTP